MSELSNSPTANRLRIAQMRATEFAGRAMQGRREAEKTRCPKGHLYDGENTWRSADGSRRCRTCDRENKQARREALKENPVAYQSHLRAERERKNRRNRELRQR